MEGYEEAFIELASRVPEKADLIIAFVVPVVVVRSLHCSEQPVELSSARAGVSHYVHCEETQKSPVHIPRPANFAYFTG
jgi:hypothetical protein